MKKLIQYSLACFLLLGSEVCDAALIYSFEGYVSNLFSDNAGILASEGYELGDYVYAKFYVDFNEDGYYITNDGEKLIPKNPDMTNNPFWYFFASLIEGTRLPGSNGGTGSIMNEYYIGYNNSGPTGNNGALEGGTGDSEVTILKTSNLSADPQNWVVGEELKGIFYAYDGEDSSIMWASMVLTEIKTVPLPSCFWILLSGILVFPILKKCGVCINSYNSNL